MPLSAFKDEDSSKHSKVSAIVALDTYVVVRPRQQKFDYVYDAEAGTLTNSGNTFFRVILNKGCASEDDEHAIVLNLLPKQSVQHALLQGQNRKYIVAFGHYKRLGTQCFEDVLAEQ